MQIAFIFALILATLPLSMAQAAQLCSQVFQGEAKLISDEAIAVSVRQMAELKLNLDQSLIQGSREKVGDLHALAQFPQKYQELVKRLQGRLSEKEIADLIQKEIRQLQSELKDRAREKNHQTKEEKEFIENTTPFEYEMVSNKPGRSFLGRSNQSEKIFLPEEDAFFYFNREHFLKFSLKKGFTEIIRKGASTGALLSDHKTMLLFQQGHLVTYDLKSKKIGRKKKVKLNRSASLYPDIQNMFLSPSDNLVLLEGFEVKVGHHFSVVNAKTGVELLNKDDFPERASGVTFLNDQQIAVVGVNQKLVIIDVATKAIVQSTTLKSIVYNADAGDSAPRVILSHDGSILTIAHANGFISLEAQNIRHTLSEVTQRDAFAQIIKARGYPHAMLLMDRTNEIQLMDMQTLATEFAFKSSEPNWTAYNILLSPDGADALIINTTHQLANGRNSEHWKRMPK